ncbi:hypothetical protein [Heyndrickxia acidicola]|uniref:Uncharacterized protein n=1 Tax=Heyndrickxia acidicola TaxID=209389 RepID=A0ABU6MG78_9BACI|nr:hypothetical protein [Heyndrickxia acidicola]MED1203418.1 hypothetical protein [Heyndrickxia acidicola]
MEKKDVLSQSEDKAPNSVEELFGIEPGMSLQSVNFAVTETPNLNERTYNDTSEE